MTVSVKVRNNFFLSFSTILIILVFDRLTKVFFSKLLGLGESIPVIKNIVHFTLVHNTGIAFGLFKNHGLLFFVIPVIVGALIIYNFYLCRYEVQVDRGTILSLALILSGAIGNMADRIIYGHVIDFIDFRVWPVFNIADSAISIGTAILLIKCIPSFAK